MESDSASPTLTDHGIALMLVPLIVARLHARLQFLIRKHTNLAKECLVVSRHVILPSSRLRQAS